MKKALLIIALISLTALSWGPRTHVEIAYRSESLLGEIYPDLHSFLVANRGAIYAGSTFPDWAFVVINDTLSWIAHSPNFGEMYLNHVLEEYPDMSSTEAQRQLAFCIGLHAHIYSDRVWHGYHDPPGMTSALEQGMSNDATSEEIIEGSLDIVVGYEYSVPSFSWFWPETTIHHVYEEWGGPEATISNIRLGTNGLESSYAASAIPGYFTYTAAKALIPWTYDNYIDYFPGGLDHVIQTTAYFSRKNWAEAIYKAFIHQRSPYDCGYLHTDDAHLLSDLPTNNTGGEDMLMATVGTSHDHGATLLRWEMDFDTTDMVLDSASIFLYYGDAGASISGEDILEIFLLNSSWNEGDLDDGVDFSYQGAPMSSGDDYACWTHRAYDSSPWSSPGADGVPGDRNATAVSSRTIDGYTAYPSWLQWDITDAVAEWIADPSSNHGVLIREVPASTPGEVLIMSGEHIEASRHPLLAVYLSPRPTTVEQEPPRPTNFKLRAYPNPFNSTITISVEQAFLPVQDGGQTEMSGLPVKIEIYDFAGRRIDHISIGEGLVPSHSSGEHKDRLNTKITWHPDDNIPSGVYLIHTSTPMPDNGLQPLEPHAVTKRIVYLK